MTVRAVADTHTVLWYLYNDARLSTAAGKVIDDAFADGDQIAISSIALVEIVYLIERGRIDSAAFDRVASALSLAGSTLVEIPVDQSIARSVREIKRAEVPEMPDRIVAATALFLGVPAITRDHKIRASAVATIW